jgi:hypothetical protein
MSTQSVTSEGERSPATRSTTGKRWLLVLGAAVIAFDAAILVLDQRMRAAGGPTILAFEFAGSRARAAHIMAEWGPKGRDAARLSLWLDYGFMLSYGAFFTLAGLLTRNAARARGWRRFAIAGAVVPFFAAAAAMFDASENVALLLTLGGHGGSFAPPFAAVCSAIKFTLITLAIFYVLFGLAQRLRQRLRPN